MLQLWENLIYDTEVKSRLLRYSESALTFSDHKVRKQLLHHTTCRPCTPPRSELDKNGLYTMSRLCRQLPLELSTDMHAGGPQHHQLESRGTELTCLDG